MGRCVEFVVGGGGVRCANVSSYGDGCGGQVMVHRFVARHSISVNQCYVHRMRDFKESYLLMVKICGVYSKYIPTM